MNKYTHARICKLYLGYQLPLSEIAKIMKVHPNTVSRTIDRVLKYRKLTDRGTELIKGYFRLEEI